MNILMIGAGGREHALCWKMKQSPMCDSLHCIPGNAGIEAVAQCHAVDVLDHTAILSFCHDYTIDFVVIGPEAPLVDGLADTLRENGVLTFGPSRAAAQIEGSKAFMKDILAKYNIPTAAYGRFTDADEACAYIEKHGAPIVVKTDGLAAGKGVIIAETIDDAKAAARTMLSGEAFGAAGNEVVIEEFLEGEEVSYFALCHGKDILPLASAQDHKAVGDGDTGPNTGGMGAYSPAHMVTQSLEEDIIAKAIQPLADACVAEGCPFEGVIFAGLMLTPKGLRVLEYNVRFGDPECQALMMRLKGDLVAILSAMAAGDIAAARAATQWDDDAALCVVMAARGYPGMVLKGTVIGGIEDADAIEHATVFHAGTDSDSEGRITAIGGRVLGVTGQGASIAAAQKAAYDAVAEIVWPEGFCRSDIGWRAVKALQAAE